ncbi:MAG: hypothetical protein Q9206_007193 [Seirophora lacunosa]
MNKKALGAGVAVVVCLAAVGGGVTYYLVNKKRKSKQKPDAPATSSTASPTPTDIGATSSVTSTPLPKMMTDEQAEVWAANVKIMMETKDMDTSIAASSVLLPLQDLGMTAEQLKRLNVEPPNSTNRGAIKTRQQDVPQPGGMSDSQAKVYVTNCKLYTADRTQWNAMSQADKNAVVSALAPLVNMSVTGWQLAKAGGAPQPDDRLKKSVAEDFATLKETGKVP